VAAGKKSGTYIDPEHMATVVLDADLLGVSKAAKAHRISVTTVGTYRRRIRNEPEAFAILVAKKRDLETRWRTARVNFLLRAVARLDELLPKMQQDQARDIVGAIKILGELHTEQQVFVDDLANERAASRPEDSPAAPPAPDGAGGTEPPPLH